jgi:hypothetical protein
MKALAAALVVFAAALVVFCSCTALFAALQVAAVTPARRRTIRSSVRGRKSNGSEPALSPPQAPYSAPQAKKNLSRIRSKYTILLTSSLIVVRAHITAHGLHDRPNVGKRAAADDDDAATAAATAAAAAAAAVLLLLLLCCCCSGGGGAGSRTTRRGLHAAALIRGHTSGTRCARPLRELIAPGCRLPIIEHRLLAVTAALHEVAADAVLLPSRRCGCCCRHAAKIFTAYRSETNAGRR